MTRAKEEKQAANLTCYVYSGRFVLDARMHRSVLANHPGHRLPLCRNASQEGGPDYGSPKSFLCLRLRNPVLDIRLLALSITDNKSHSWRLVVGCLPQCPCSAINGQPGYSRHSLYDHVILSDLERRITSTDTCPRCRIWLHIRFLHCHDFGRGNARTRQTVAQYAFPSLLDNFCLLLVSREHQHPT